MANGKAIVYNGQVIGTPSGVCAIDNLVAENIKSGVNVGGVVGNFEAEAQAITSNIFVSSYTGTIQITGLTKEPTAIILKRSIATSTPVSLFFKPSKTTQPTIVVGSTSANVYLNAGTNVVSYSNGTLTINTQNQGQFQGTYTYWLY